MIRAASAVLVTAVVGLVWGLLHVAWYRHGQVVDYAVYRFYGDLVVHAHDVPYRDFSVEYPPAALPVFIVPAALEGVGFNGVFQALMALFHLATALCVLALVGRRAALAVAIAPLLLGSVVISRFDFWPAALVVAALLALDRDRIVLGGALLGTAFAAKLWPAVLVPLVVVLLWRRSGPRRARVWLLSLGVTIAVWFVPFIALSWRGVGHSFRLQVARPLQIESLGAAMLVAAHHVFGTTLHIVNSYGSQNVAGPGVGAVSAATDVLEAIAVIGVWVLFARGEPSMHRLLVSGAAAVCALIAFGKVFSPQFLIWLIALVPLAAELLPLAVLGVALVLTQVYFPRRYWPYSVRFAPTQAWVIFARDLVVVALFAALTAAVAGRRFPVRWTR